MRGFSSRAPLTQALLLTIGAVFVAELYFGGSESREVLIRLGANWGIGIARGEVWRLLTSMFLHIGFLHLAVNGWALYQLGTLMETWVGSRRYGVIYFLGGLAGSAASFVWNSWIQGVPEAVSAGASGAIFGVLGGLISFLLRRHERLTPAARGLLMQLLFWAGLNVFLGMTTPGIDNAGHLGGLAVGLLFGLSLRLRGE